MKGKDYLIHMFEFKNNISSLFVTLTNRCNLKCSYCSADAGPQGKLMANITTVADQIQKWIESSSNKEGWLIFTGGEPTMYGYSNLNKLAEDARKIAKLNQFDLRIGIQTNGTLIKEEFVEICKKWKIEPGVSFDGDIDIHNKYRGNGAHVVKGLKTLRSNNIPFSVIVCLTREIIPILNNTLNWFSEEGIFKIRINILGKAPESRNAEILSGDEIFTARRIIYEHMERDEFKKLKEKNVLDMVNAFDAHKMAVPFRKGHCKSAKCGAGIEIASLNPDGKFSMCVEKSMTDGLPGGAQDLAELKHLASSYWNSYRSWDSCNSCPAYSICDHGCEAYHKNGYSNFENECKGTKLFYNYLKKVRDYKAVSIL